MSRERVRGLTAIGIAVLLTAAGALLALYLGGSEWAPAGAVIGAVTAAYGPIVAELLGVPEATRWSWLRITEGPPPDKSPARLLHPRLEKVDFAGRKSELDSLILAFNLCCLPGQLLPVLSGVSLG
jgi:hypothetical protein